MGAVNSSDFRNLVRSFLSSRRARISPEQAGFAVGGRRRVPGLRREEVALLAGVSTEWYIRLEKGHIAEISDDVLDAVAQALRLDGEERAYLFDLARSARSAQGGHLTSWPERKQPVPDQVQWMLDSITLSAAFVTNGHWDILASNALGKALFSPMFESVTTRSAGITNVARFHFLDPGAPDFYADWATAATSIVALLLATGGRRPHDAGLQRLICDLTSESAEFGRRWATHDILIHHRGRKAFVHPDAGRTDLAYYSLDLPTADDAGLILTTYTAEPGSASEDRLRFLASWTAPDPVGRP